jgi:3'5'-cyclic nucleotide phosphodiesterase
MFLELHGEDLRSYYQGDISTIECLRDDKNRLFVLELMLHSADISNPYKPVAICSKWADLVVEEFSLQGDREKKEGLEVSPMMDRDSINLCNMQMGFIEFAVAPLLTGDQLLKNHGVLNVFIRCFFVLLLP